MTEGAQTQCLGYLLVIKNPKINFEEGFTADPIHISSRVMDGYGATVVNPSSLNECVLCGNLKRGWLEEGGPSMHQPVCFKCPDSLTHSHRDRERMDKL